MRVAVFVNYTNYDRLHFVDEQTYLYEKCTEEVIEVQRLRIMIWIRDWLAPGFKFLTHH